MPSMVWTCFEKTEAGPKCLICADLRKRRDSSTKTMWVHLKLKHLEIYQRLRNADNSNKVTSFKSEESTKTKQDNSQILNQYNNLLMSNYLTNLIRQPIQQQQQPIPNTLGQNTQDFQNLAFNKFFLDVYVQLVANTPSTATLPIKMEEKQPNYDLASHWPEIGSSMQNCAGCSMKTILECKKCNNGLCIGCFQKFHNS